jgi:ribosomal protein S1
VQDVSTVVSAGQEVDVWVVTRDESLQRFGLSLLKPGAPAEQDESGEARPARAVATRGALKPRAERGDDAASRSSKTLSAKRGDWVEGTVKSVMAFGAIVEVEEGISGLLHVSEMSGATVRLCVCLVASLTLPPRTQTRLTRSLRRS